MGRFLVALLCTLSGCHKLFDLNRVSGSGADDAGTSDAEDAPPDVDLTLVDAGPCPGNEARYGKYGSGGAGMLAVCAAASAAQRTLGGPLSTLGGCDFTVAQDTIGTDVCVIVADVITVTGTFTPRGPRPLALVGISSVIVDGTIDVAAHTGATAEPPGANWLGCGAGFGQSGGTVGGAGGAGGTFGTSGGMGGANAAGGGGAPQATSPLDRVRGGCAGGRGGAGFNSNPGGEGGDGGGAIYLIGGASIELRSNARINASGAGGRGGVAGGSNIAGGGGGGGGSGGLIGIDTPMVTVDTAAVLVANGGGGGAGASSTAQGMSGADPAISTLFMPASGGVGAGGNGGSGFAGSSAPANGTSSKSGGGGGGGGGYVAIYSPVAPVVINVSPPASSP